MKTGFAAIALTTAMFAAGCGADGPSARGFVGSYRATLTVSGQGSTTLTDVVTISEGTTSDLIVTSQNMGAMKATILDEHAFMLDQQSILLTSNGAAFSATLEGQGTATAGVLSVNGTLSNADGTLSFSLSGSRL